MQLTRLVVHSSVTSTRANAAKIKSGRPTEEVAMETLSAHITNAADRIFSTSSTLSGVSGSFLSLHGHHSDSGLHRRRQSSTLCAH